MADLDDIPPLEDMSEVLDKLGYTKALHSSEKSKHHETQHALRSEPVQKENGGKFAPQAKDARDSKKSGYGGMQKGFLFGASTPKSKSTADNAADKSIPFIKPKQNKTESLSMPEVQHAMTAGQEFVKNKEWITPDILQQIQGNELLSQRLSDPQFMQAIAEFQTNPTGAMQKYQNNKEIMSFLQSFCGIMGEHFNKLADQQQKPAQAPSPSSEITLKTHDTSGAGADLKVHSSTNPRQATAADEARMQQILNDPETRDILLDPRIQKLIETLRTDPDKAQRALQACDHDMRRNIQRLVDVGLLQFQSS